MKTKHLMVAGIAALALSTGSILAINQVSADEAANGIETKFVEKLATKLGLTTEAVTTAVESTREEIHTEIEAKREEAIAEAVSAGKLTQRQADILNAIDEAHQTIRANRIGEMHETMQSLNREERRAEMEEQLVETLNAAGLNTSAEEVESTHEAARDAQIMIGLGHGGMAKGQGFGNLGM